MQGRMDELLDALVEHDRAEKLKALGLVED
jgi:protein subunit release factor A